MFTFTTAVTFSLLLSSCTAVLNPGHCPVRFIDSLEETKLNLRNVLHLNLTLVPVLMTELESAHYTIPFDGRLLDRHFLFGLSYGARSCVGNHYLGINGEDKDPYGMFQITGSSIYGRATVLHNATNGDWLVFLCEYVGGDRHVAQFFLMQRKDKISKKSMRKENLIRKYGETLKGIGLGVEQVKAFDSGDYKYCDEALQDQLSGYGVTLFWFRTVVLALIAIMLIITIAGFAIRFFNAMTKLNKVRTFSAS